MIHIFKTEGSINKTLDMRGNIEKGYQILQLYFIRTIIGLKKSIIFDQSNS